MATDGTGEGEKKDDNAPVASATTKKPPGFVSRICRGIFGRDDIDKRLERISKEEAAIHSRMRKRSISRSRIRGQAILFSILLEVIAVVSAIMTRGHLEMDLKIRALRILPMFLWPGLSFVSYSAYRKLTDMRDKKDQKTLKRLQTEKKELLDDLKDKNKFYEIQEMIQKYDTDPAAKAAAAAVLASKLGADSGLKVYLEDDALVNAASVGKSNDVELVQTSGLRKRKDPLGRSASDGSTKMIHPSEREALREGNKGMVSSPQPLVVDHYDPQGQRAQDSGWVTGWISQAAAFLVGEDPTQSYALICGNCLRHNGLVGKEDFPHTKYYCPHCGALNQPKNSHNALSVSSSSGSPSPTAAVATRSPSIASPKEAVATRSSSPAATAESEIVEAAEQQVAAPIDSVAQ